VICSTFNKTPSRVSHHFPCGALQLRLVWG
jgi:hypothetical protein